VKGEQDEQKEKGRIIRESRRARRKIYKTKIPKNRKGDKGRPGIFLLGRHWTRRKVTAGKMYLKSKKPKVSVKKDDSP